MGIHWTACAWAVLGRVTLEDGDMEPYPPEECSDGGSCESGIWGSPWMIRYGVHGSRATKWEQYMTALNFAAAGVTGASTDVMAGNMAERVFLCLLNVVAFLLCAMLLASVVAVVTQVQEDNKVFWEGMSQMQMFMARRAIPVSLQLKVKRYLRFQHRAKRHQLGARLQAVIDQLSPFLRMKLMLSVHRQTLEYHTFFERMGSVMLAGVCARAESVVFAPGDAVVQRGAVASSMFFIVSGRVQVIGSEVRKKNGIAFPGSLPPSFLDPPSYFGDLALFKALARAQTIVSIEHTELLMVSRPMLLDLAAEMPAFDKYYRKAVAAVERGDLVAAGLQCGSCRGMGHTTARCPTRRRQGRTSIIPFLQRTSSTSTVTASSGRAST
mmetsp:Transcript_116761/g.267976  ORF Transcript_116761/g.267976 Transcript_116761/m.267976 type:complete len:382 (+) Transcript_116761:1-1146(+)